MSKSNNKEEAHQEDYNELQSDHQDLAKGLVDLQITKEGMQIMFNYGDLYTVYDKEKNVTNVMCAGNTLMYANGVVTTENVKKALNEVAINYLKIKESEGKISEGLDHVAELKLDGNNVGVDYLLNEELLNDSWKQFQDHGATFADYDDTNKVPLMHKDPQHFLFPALMKHLTPVSSASNMEYSLRYSIFATTKVELRADIISILLNSTNKKNADYGKYGTPNQVGLLIKYAFAAFPTTAKKNYDELRNQVDHAEHVKKQILEFNNNFLDKFSETNAEDFMEAVAKKIQVSGFDNIKGYVLEAINKYKSVNVVKIQQPVINNIQKLIIKTTAEKLQLGLPDFKKYTNEEILQALKEEAKENKVEKENKLVTHLLNRLSDFFKYVDEFSANCPNTQVIRALKKYIQKNNRFEDLREYVVKAIDQYKMSDVEFSRVFQHLQKEVEFLAKSDTLFYDVDFGRYINYMSLKGKEYTEEEQKQMLEKQIIKKEGIFKFLKEDSDSYGNKDQIQISGFKGEISQNKTLGCESPEDSELL